MCFGGSRKRMKGRHWKSARATSSSTRAVDEEWETRCNEIVMRDTVDRSCDPADATALSHPATTVDLRRDLIRKLRTPSRANWALAEPQVFTCLQLPDQLLETGACTGRHIQELDAHAREGCFSIADRNGRRDVDHAARYAKRHLVHMKGHFDLLTNLEWRICLDVAPAWAQIGDSAFFQWAHEPQTDVRRTRALIAA